MLFIELYSEKCNFVFCQRPTQKDTKNIDNFGKEVLKHVLCLSRNYANLHIEIAHYSYRSCPDSLLIYTSTEDTTVHVN